MLKKFFIPLLFLMLVQAVRAQELQARISIIANKVSNQVDRKVFQTLQSALTNFVSNRKWTGDNFQRGERINCSFLITIEKELGDNVYKASLTVQAARPIYNTTYESPLINFMDDNLTFRYVEFQPIDFNESRVQGSDPEEANLPAVLAYWAYMILGMDYDAYSLRGGDTYFQKAWNIVNNAPEGRDITGWKPLDGLRNRYYLAENINSSKFALIHDAIYTYYRSGLDNFYDKETEARNGIVTCLNYLNRINTDNPNSMLIQFFFQGKSGELIRIFSKADNDLKTRAR
ncbi:MAG TPA: DUF4835 family protein, partial [Chitinophagaceae bacterium]